MNQLISLSACFKNTNIAEQKGKDEEKWLFALLAILCYLCIKCLNYDFPTSTTVIYGRGVLQNGGSRHHKAH